jgi:starvation-inducible DNA-binding protein
MTTSMNNGIPDDRRAEIVDALSHALGDTYAVYLKTHSYHWNVVGPMFHSLHTMFMEQYTELALAVDELAERIRALGSMAPGTYRELGTLTSVPEDTDAPSATEMVARLVAAHETCARNLRDGLAVAESASDQVTTDLFVRRLEVHEKTAWMLRSTLA